MLKLVLLFRINFRLLLSLRNIVIAILKSIYSAYVTNKEKNNINIGLKCYKLLSLEPVYMYHRLASCYIDLMKYVANKIYRNN